MKQPQLGQKILELRKAKGLTQEELVEKCNINVRTIQRIEAGEVSPRNYTVRLIFEALGYPYPEEVNTRHLLESVRDRCSLASEADVLKAKKWLGISLVAGILYYLLVFVEAGMDSSLMRNKLDPNLGFWYPVVKLLVCMGICLFIQGYYRLGTLLENKGLQMAAIVYVIVFFGVIGMDLFVYFGGGLTLEYLLPVKSVLYGLVLFLFSLALISIQKTLGPIALVTGALGIFNALLFISVILAIPGILLLALVELLQLVLIWMAFRHLAQTKKEEGMQNMAPGFGS